MRLCTEAILALIGCTVRCTVPPVGAGAVLVQVDGSCGCTKIHAQRADAALQALEGSTATGGAVGVYRGVQES